MSEQPHDALYHQCLRRVETFASQLSQGNSIPDLADRVACLVKRNRHRIPSTPSPDPQTGIPDEYIDDVIQSVVKEGPWLNALRARDSQAWDKLLALIKKRVRSNLYPRYDDWRFITPFDVLVDDITIHCAGVLWRKLEHFPFDTPLEAWVSCFVAYEVSTIHRSADFRRNVTARSLDSLLLGTDLEGTVLADVLPDHRATRLIERVDDKLVIMAALGRLSPDQREVVVRQLHGQTTADIAREMGRSRAAVNQLRHKAVTKLRCFVSPDMEVG